MMHVFEIDGRRYAQFERLRQHPGLVHAFSTRPTDVSAREDAQAPERAARRERMARDLGLDPRRLCYLVQVHGTTLAEVDEATPAGPIVGADAAVTCVPGRALMTFSADCPLVLVFDPGRRALGVAHASWRCTVARSAERLVGELARRYGSKPRSLRAGIGPSAGPCCYEVRDDVCEAARGLDRPERLFERRDGRTYFDLWRANRLQLEAAGVPAESVEVAGVCTMCRNDLFFSFRREGPGCGHFGLLAGLAC